MTEFITLISWWVATTVLGAIAFPIAFLTFRHLPDRGYAVSRVLGLLLASYVAWLAGHQVSGILPIAVGIAAVAGLSAYLGRGLWAQQAQFLKSQRGFIVGAELVFFSLLVFGVWYESSTGAIFQTEKPADYSVLLGIMTSSHMPPRDLWLSGTYISYYYFGYFMLAVLAKLTGTIPGIAHNMGLALTMAFTGLVAFGLGYALTGRRRWGLLLVFAMTFMGNLDYWFRAPHAYQFGDLQTRYLSNHPADPAIKGGVGGMFEYLLNMMLGSSPQNHNWEYFQASRIVDLTPGEHLISEFPAFSFVLADVHPHLLALPFFMLALALSLSIAKAPLPGWQAFGNRRGWQVALAVVASLVYGSLGFINSWDLPTVLAVLGIALVLRELWLVRKIAPAAIVRALLVGVPIVVLAVGAYIPFYLTLRTQARGIGITNGVIPTATGPVAGRTDIYYWLVIVGPFLFVLVPALIARARGVAPARTPAPSPSSGQAPRVAAEVSKSGRARRKREVVQKASPAERSSTRPSRACSVCGVAAAADVNVCSRCGGDVSDVEMRADLPDGALRADLAAVGRWLGGAVPPWGRVLGIGLGALAIADALFPLWNPSVTLFSLLLIALALAAIAVRGESRELSFATALVAIGFLLIAGCEWFYVRDLFSMFPHLYRMNTVFKLYMQAWVLLSAGSVALLAWFWEAEWPRWHGTSRRIWLGIAVFVGIAVGIFPIAAYHNRVSLYGTPTSQLDGTEYLSAVSPDDGHAVEWLRENIPMSDPRPVMLQAWGGSFTLAAAASTFSGLATVLAWEGHEEQWRGGKERPVWHGVDAEDTVMRRYGDVDTLYQTVDIDLTRRLLRRYNVKYVYVGPTERQKYPTADFSKWQRLGRLLYNQDAVSIYDVGP